MAGRIGTVPSVTQQLANLKELVRPYYLKGLYFPVDERHRPRNFTACWNYPISDIESAGLGASPLHHSRPDIVFLPMADWHGCFQRSQQLASTFAKLGHRCFYLNPHLGREFPNTYFRSSRKLLGNLAPNVWELHVHLLREPVYHHRRLTDDESSHVAGVIAQVLRAATSESPILIASFPLWTDVARRLKADFGCPLIYDCHDLLEGFADISEDVLAAETDLLDLSDRVLFSSQWLMDQTCERHAAAAAKAMIVRNAANSHDFEPPITDAATQPKSHRTIGYVGALNFWFDAPAVRAAALTQPQWRFELIGPVAGRNLDLLHGLPNVTLRGEVPYQDLPGHLARMDVGLIPFLKSPLTLATNPIKLYEYFACGLPVVSARLPEVEHFSDLVYLADGGVQLVRQIRKALAEKGSALRRRRMAVAKRESWGSRCAAVLEQLRFPSGAVGGVSTP